jgi:hypothetical protein
MIRELGKTLFSFPMPYVIDDTTVGQVFGLQPTPWNEILENVVNGD